jgi:hypothetical protein
MHHSRVRRVPTAIAAASLVVVLLQAMVAYAAAGDLDPTFGSNGSTTVDWSASSVSDRANDVALEPDGSIVVVGSRAR